MCDAIRIDAWLPVKKIRDFVAQSVVIADLDRSRRWRRQILDIEFSVGSRECNAVLSRIRAQC